MLSLVTPTQGPRRDDVCTCIVRLLNQNYPGGEFSIPDELFQDLETDPTGNTWNWTFRTIEVSPGTDRVLDTEIDYNGPLAADPTVCVNNLETVPPEGTTLCGSDPGEPSNRNAAIALGKAFFWDMQVGSDGVQSCGTCHFTGAGVSKAGGSTTTVASEGGSAEHTALPPPTTRRHRRGHRGPADLAAVPLRALGASLAAELSTLRPQLKACAREAGALDSHTPAATAAAIREARDPALRAGEPSLSAAPIATSRGAMPRSLLLDVETGDGQAWIVGVPAADEGSAFYRCVEKALTGRTVASPGARAGRRISMMLPL